MLPTRPRRSPCVMLLKELLEPLGVSQVDAKMLMSIPFQRLNAIVKGRRTVRVETALLLSSRPVWKHGTARASSIARF
jgi:plasmid maintenance system antidote protein VapI